MRSHCVTSTLYGPSPGTHPIARQLRRGSAFAHCSPEVQLQRVRVRAHSCGRCTRHVTTRRQAAPGPARQHMIAHMTGPRTPVDITGASPGTGFVGAIACAGGVSTEWCAHAARRPVPAGEVRASLPRESRALQQHSDRARVSQPRLSEHTTRSACSDQYVKRQRLPHQPLRLTSNGCGPSWRPYAKTCRNTHRAGE